MAKRKTPTAVAYTPEVDTGVVNGEPLPTDEEREVVASDPSLDEEVLAYDKAMAAGRAAVKKAEAENEQFEGVEADPLVIASKSGDRRQLLEALRDRLAMQLVMTTSGRDVAALARNLNIISKELDGVPDPEDDGDEIDQLSREVMELQCGEAD